MARDKKNTLNSAIGAALAAASVLLWWLIKQSRFSGIGVALAAAAVTAFFIEVIFLTVLSGKHMLKRAIKIILVIYVNIAVFSTAIILSFAPAIILQPHADETSYQKLLEIPEAEEITFEGAVGEINGWFYNVAGDDAPVVLYFYGNYETAATRLVTLCSDYGCSAFVGCNFAVFDYPAYGKSEGRCTERSILSFAVDVYDEISKRTDNIIVLGYSVGTGPACYLASIRDVRGLILYAPYADTVDLYNNVLDIFYGPLELLVSFDIDSKELAKNVNEPVLILASDADELIPSWSSVELSIEFGDSCTLVKTPDISHNSFLSDLFVKEETAKFIREVTVK